MKVTKSININITAEKNLPSGVLCINKPAGVTSHDVVNIVRRMYGTKKVGHTGTLDPMATGVLVVLVGRAVKASEFLMSDSKEYIAGIRFGVTSNTQDSTGEVTSLYDGELPEKEQIEAVLADFTGKIEQIPPMYSALKRGGKKLYELARAGVHIEREAREIFISSIRYEGAGKGAGEHYLRIDCSKGTYIRTLCHDIGNRIGCGALMYSLKRVRSGNHTIDDCITIEQLEKMSEKERIAALTDVDGSFEGLRRVSLPSFYEKLARCGNEIYLHRISADIPLGETVRLCAGGKFFALGRVEAYPDGNAIKPIKQFDVRSAVRRKEKKYMFNAEKVKNDCVKWIREFFENNGKGCNAVLGISGGKDSSVSAALCVEALGKDRVIGVLMPNGEQSDIDSAYLLVNHLGIKHYVVNIRDAYDGIMNAIPKELEISQQSKINLAPRLRMSTVYAVSQSCNGRVVNTCNLSEDYVGYSTRYGDSVGDFSPLSGLTVNEVKQIGRLLGLPAALVDKVPGDGLTGKSDEDNLGFTYEVLDRYIRTGEIDDPEAKAKIDRLHKLNKFKLELMPSFKPEI